MHRCRVTGLRLRNFNERVCAPRLFTYQCVSGAERRHVMDDSHKRKASDASSGASGTGTNKKRPNRLLPLSKSSDQKAGLSPDNGDTIPLPPVSATEPSNLLEANALWLSIPEDWRDFLRPDLDASEFLALAAKVERAYEQETVYPPRPHIFRALELCPVSTVGVVVVGQDPYHTAHQANGLAFSCTVAPLQPSLRNILDEVRRDYPGVALDSELQRGNLESWAKQGVLLLNATLTVRARQANSHRSLGWTWFTATVLRRLSTHKSHLVFLLWGKPARELVWPLLGFKPLTRHQVLCSSHPSPLSVTTATAEAPAFRASHHFRQCNDYRQTHQLPAIQWWK